MLWKWSDIKRVFQRKPKTEPGYSMEDYFNDPAVIAHYQERARAAGVVVRDPATGEWTIYRRGPRSWSQYRYIVGADPDDPYVGEAPFAVTTNATDRLHGGMM